MLRHQGVHPVVEDDIGLAGLDAGRQDADPQAAGADRADNSMIMRTGQRPFLVFLNRTHEGVGDKDAVMQVRRLAVGITPGRAANLDKLLDLRMGDGEVHGRRAAAQRPLADGEGQAVHDTDEGHHAGGLADRADTFADRAQIAPVAADAAALGRQPDIFRPEIDDSLQAVVRFIEEAGNRQTARRAAVGENRRRGHEPELADILIDALRMGVILAIGAGHPAEQILEAFLGQKIAVFQHRHAEFRQIFVATMVNMDPRAILYLNDIR